jgi:hypothetical protein
MVAGWDGDENSDSEAGGEPALYWLDDLGSVKRVQYGAHGPETPFLLSMLDQKGNILHKQVATSSSSERKDRFLSAALLTRNCWLQMQQRARGKIDVHSAKLYCVDSVGCFEQPLPHAEDLSEGE